MVHLAEADDHPGVRQPQMVHQGARDALRAEVQVVLVGEGHIRGHDAGRVGEHGLA
jgi:hypothetical protein